jgi:hypothetical protein
MGCLGGRSCADRQTSTSPGLGRKPPTESVFVVMEEEEELLGRKKDVKNGCLEGCAAIIYQPALRQPARHFAIRQSARRGQTGLARAGRREGRCSFIGCARDRLHVESLQGRPPARSLGHSPKQDDSPQSTRAARGLSAIDLSWRRVGTEKEHSRLPPRLPHAASPLTEHKLYSTLHYTFPIT